MNFQDCQEYLANKPESEVSFPFDPDVYVYKVADKMFALLSPKGQLSDYNPKQHPQLNLKCDPEHAQELRDVFKAIIPGYHMNKKHWNTLILDGSLPASEISRLIDHSYGLIVSKLTAAQRKPLELKYGPDNLYNALLPYA
ncbi:MAG: MmcQ/YjbR family DNA-binding protein [Gammaproteobacteria bacterium]|nr:MmcQ/YjbR family DNA-binding protein [Gammaproteobacteria bacterium]